MIIKGAINVYPRLPMILGTALGPFGLMQVSKSDLYFKLKCVLFHYFFNTTTALNLFFLGVIMLVGVFSKFVM